MLIMKILVIILGDIVVILEIIVLVQKMLKMIRYADFRIGIRTHPFWFELADGGRKC